MNPVGILRTYVDRRIVLPVGTDDLVLDVGGGDQPHWRADVVVDRFPDEDHAAQRFLGGGVRLDRPVFAVDASTLPFRDDSFDYVVCSHTLEHVGDPSAVIGEMMRVAPRGYIEVPAVGMAKIKDFPTHLWWCSLDDGTLVFRAKEERAFDPDIDRLLDVPAIRRAISWTSTTNFEHCIVAVRWERPIAVRVEGRADLALAETTEHVSPPTSFLSRISRHLNSRIASVAWDRRRARRPLVIADLTDDRSFGSPDTPLRPGIIRSLP